MEEFSNEKGDEACIEHAAGFIAKKLFMEHSELAD